MDAIEKKAASTYNAEDWDLDMSDLDNMEWPDNESNVCGIDLEKLHRDLRFEIPGLFGENGFIVLKRHHNVFAGESI